jgi:hypothetical protein
MARETQSDLALGLAVLVYLVLVLFGGVELPVIGVVLLALSVHALARPHRANHHRRH